MARLRQPSRRRPSRCSGSVRAAQDGAGGAWTLPILFGLALFTATGATPTLLAAQSWRTVTISRQVDRRDDLDVRVRYGAGRFRVAGADSGVLYRMQLHYDENSFEPLADYDPGRGRLELGIRGSGEHDLNLDGNDRAELDLKLSRDVPMTLELQLGAVRAELDLGGLSLTGLDLTTGAAEARMDVSSPNPSSMDRARIAAGAAKFDARRLGNLNARLLVVEAGVGDVRLDFTGSWEEDADVTVEMALGSLELTFPRDVGVRIEKRTFLTSVDAREMVQRSRNEWVSSNWDTARHRIRVRVKAAFGGIDVNWAG